MKTKSERIHLLFNQLNQAAPASSISEAIDQVEKTLDSIENQFSGLPYNRDNWGKGGRMYLPPSTVVGAWKVTADFKRADVSGNYFYFHSDGSMACANNKTAVIKWAKTGANSFEAPQVGSIHPDKLTWPAAEVKDYFASSNLDLAKSLQDYGLEDEVEAEEPPQAEPVKDGWWTRVKKVLGIHHRFSK